jgi:hypothetical protein
MAARGLRLLPLLGVLAALTALAVVWVACLIPAHLNLPVMAQAAQSELFGVQAARFPPQTLEIYDGTIYSNRKRHAN